MIVFKLELVTSHNHKNKVDELLKHKLKNIWIIYYFCIFLNVLLLKKIYVTIILTKHLLYKKNNNIYFKKKTYGLFHPDSLRII